MRFLTESQVEDLRRAVKKASRNSHRDSTMILVAYRHGLRIGELTDLRWEDVHLDRAEIYVRRVKGMKRVVSAARVDGGCHASPKGLRHAFGVSALQSDVPLNMVQKSLGHANINTTTIYTDAVGAEEREIARRMWARSASGT